MNPIDVDTTLDHVREALDKQDWDQAVALVEAVSYTHLTLPTN